MQEVKITDSRIDGYALRDTIVQGESGSDVITFVIPRKYDDDTEEYSDELLGYTWRVRGTINGGSVQSSDITPREERRNIYIDWTVGSTFTGNAGIMYLTLVGVKDEATIAKAVGSVEILPDMAMQAAGTVTQNLFEQLIAAIGNKAEDAEAWAVGTRNGIPVSAEDPAYHNNSLYYSQHSATVNAGTATTLPYGSAPTVENVGTESDAVFNFGIPSGEPGQRGETATVSVGTVTTLPAGSEASVTNVGTETDAVFNFALPRGYDGTGSGSVNSVSVENAPNGGLTVSGSPVTSTGTIVIGHENIVPDKNALGIYPFKYDANGHITETGEAIQPIEATHTEITLSASSWSNGEQSVFIGVFDADTTNFIVSPNGNSFESYSESMIRAISYDTPNLIFKAKTVPSVDITVNVMIVKEA